MGVKECMKFRLKLMKEGTMAETALIAYFIDIPALNAIFISLLPSLSGRLMVLMYLFSGLLFVLFVCLSLKRKRRVNFKLLILIIFVICGYLLTLVSTPYTDLNWVNFSIYTILSLLFVLLFQVNTKLLLQCIMTFTAIGFFNINAIFVTSSNLYETITMGVSYAFMPTIIAAIVYCFIYYKEDSFKYKIINGIVLIINLLYFLKIIQFGSRGVVLSLLSCVLFFFCFKYDEKKEKVCLKSYKAIILAIIFAFFVMNLWSVFEYISNLVESAGFHINAINKFFRLMDSSSNDITNGRLAIYMKTINGIWQSLLWGHGYSTTQHNLGIVYPHNFLLQLLYDGGIVLTTPIIVLSIKGAYSWYKSCTKNEYAIVVALFFMSIPGALFSGNLWENNRLWITLAVLVCFSTLKRNKTRGIICIEE